MSGDVWRVRVPTAAGDLGDPVVVAQVRAKVAGVHPRGVVVAIDRETRIATVADEDGGGGELPVTMVLADVAKAADAATLAVKVGEVWPGWTLTSFDLPSRRAVRAMLDPVTLAARDAVARALAVAPWEVQVEVEVVDGELDEVWIAGPGLVGLRVEARAKLLEHCATMVVGHSGWRVKEDLRAGTARLVRGAAIDIPVRAPFDWERIGAGGWAELPFGTDGRGQPLTWDMAANPHALCVGRTGSGKSILLEALIVGALTNGFELAVVDPTKRGLDFRPFEPWVRPGGWGCKTYEEAYETLRQVYAEAVRRVDLLDDLGVPKWTALSEAQREEYGIRPIFVVIDEATSLAKEVPVPKALPKDDPERVEAEALNLLKARIMILLGKIARECRFVGIHEAVGTQRFDVANFGSGAGELRENLGCRILMGKSSRTAIGMAVADPEMAVEAHEAAHGVTASDADTNEAVKRPGRGIAEIDGLGTVPFQGWYAEQADLVAFLDERGVPRRAGHVLSRPSVVPSDSPTGVPGTASKRSVGGDAKGSASGPDAPAEAVVSVFDALLAGGDGPAT